MSRVKFKGLYTLMFFFLWTACQNSPDRKADAEEINVPPNVLTSTMEEELDWDLWPIDTSVIYVTGHFEPASDTVFRLVQREKADRSGMYLRKDTYRAFLAMDSAARAEGVFLQIRSATRNFNSQKSIWEKKWTGRTPIENGEKLNETTPDPVQRALKILRFSSMPGSSRHHWGTDIDLNNFTNQFFEHDEGLILYNWLQNNGAKYGFRQPYTERDSLRPVGYNEEKWHWSFYPVADVLTAYASEHLKDSMITGFLGAETAEKIHIVEKYVLGINPALLPDHH